MPVLEVLLLLLLLKAVGTAALALLHRRHYRHLDSGAPGGVTVMIAAYNEEVGIRATLESVLSEPLERLQVVVVDDGSSDRTPDIVGEMARHDPRITFLRQANAGKAEALNRALTVAEYEVAVSVDADSVLAPGSLGWLAAHFKDPRVGAVAGDVRVSGRPRLLTHIQYLEYMVGQHMEKRAQDMLGVVLVVPGAAGAYRTALLRQLGGYSPDTLTEDLDLTVAIAAAGFQVRFEPRALSYTEPPVYLRYLWRQRMRWTYGTFQVMAKYRRLVFNPRAGRLGLLALPYVLIYGFMLGVVGPLFDLTVVLLAVQTSVFQVAGPLLLNVGAELSVGLLSLWLGRGAYGGLGWAPLQRLFLRPFMAVVVAMTAVSLLRRQQMGWNKLPRLGVGLSTVQRLELEPQSEVLPSSRGAA